MTDSPECLTAQQRNDLMVACFERLIQSHSKATLALFLAQMTVHGGSSRADITKLEADLTARLQQWAETAREYNSVKRFNARVAAIEEGRKKTRGRGRR